jgi:hypothetical protein
MLTRSHAVVAAAAALCASVCVFADLPCPYMWPLGPGDLRRWRRVWILLVGCLVPPKKNLHRYIKRWIHV